MRRERTGPSMPAMSIGHEDTTAPAPPQLRLLDPATLGDTLDRLYRAALSYCHGSRERAEDLVQDTYVRVLARPRFLRSNDDVGYLLRTMRNTFLSDFRRARTRPALAAIDGQDWIEDPSAPQPQAIMESRLVYEAISALPPNFRDALIAVDVTGLRYREAAVALEIPEATLTSRLFRARKRVADALTPPTTRT